jgi:hypothetical protein
MKRDKSRHCQRCLGTMPVGRYTQRCDRCDGKPWPCVPQVVVADVVDQVELERICDRDEAEAWERHERLRARERRQIEEQLADYMAADYPARRSTVEEHIAQLRAQLARL